MKNDRIPKVSVIVPVYNVAPYLKKCLCSLVDQTLNDIEIIVIDDGSTDVSSSICDSFADDQRFCIIHKKNGGLSSARNAGMKIARADFIMFVDSDDWVEPDFCEVPYTLATEYNADIIFFSIEVAIWIQVCFFIILEKLREYFRRKRL